MQTAKQGETIYLAETKEFQVFTPGVVWDVWYSPTNDTYCVLWDGGNPRIIQLTEIEDVINWIHRAAEKTEQEIYSTWERAKVNSDGTIYVGCVIA